MERQEMLKKVVEFQKTSFDTTYDMISGMQDQTQNMVKQILDKTPAIPEKNLQTFTEWIETCKKNRQAFKTTMDNNFDAWSACFEAL